VTGTEISDTSSVSLPIVISIVGVLFGLVSMLLANLGRSTIKVLQIGIETAKQQADMALTKYADSLRENGVVHMSMLERIHKLERDAALEAQSGAQTARSVVEIRESMVTREVLGHELRTQTAELKRTYESSSSVPVTRLDPRREGR
jgi:hypothetical protein